MFFRRHVPMMLCVLLLLSVVVSCGPSATEAPEPTMPPATSAPAATTPPEPTEAPEPTTPPEPVTLKLWKFASADPKQAEWVNKWIDVYMEENPHVTIVYEEHPFAGYEEEILPTSFTAEDSPDVFWATTSATRRYSEEGLLVPLDDYLSDEFIQEVSTAVMAPSIRDGQIMSLPFEWGTTMIMYRTDFWQEAGLTEDDIPENWDELRDVAMRLTADDHYGLYIGTMPTPHSVWHFTGWLWSAGGDVVDDELTTVLFDSPEAVRTLQIWQDMMNVDNSLVPTALSPCEALGSGKAAMEWGSTACDGIFSARYAEMYDKWDLFPLPAPDGGIGVGVGGGYRLHISAQSEHPEEAGRFAAWLMAEDPDRVAEWNGYARPLLPAWDAVYETELYQEFLSEPRLAEFAANAEYTRAANDWPPEIVTSVINAIQGVLFGDVSPEDAVATAASEIDSYLADR
jgi:ABC-type glycerol-3-phosphate transport system substrate-binding protein